MITYTLKVVDIRKETQDTITLSFKQPGLKKIKYKAGQYLSLFFRINGRRYIRPYSFSSSPSTDSKIEVTVKRVANGIVSNHVHDRVQVGDLIEAMEPMGDFTYESKENIKSIFFWGAGSGITPLFSIIKEVLNSEPLVPLTLIYGNRNFESTIFANEIELLLNVYPDRFKIWHFQTKLSVINSDPYIIEGRINRDFVIRVLKDVNIIQSMHYICGPTGLKDSVCEGLNSLGVPSENIFFEEFEMVKDPEELQDISTQTVKIIFQKIEYNLEIVKGQSILESALDTGLELPYSCQTGNCSSCMASCVRGSVKMIGPGKKRIDLLANECLLCCSYPKSGDVCLEIN
ncbi:MAG TPA: ferredoxin--NADP reductase [Sphingobacteriaceae bacterium]|nr:ferredoxin--NADP reductase [Sphingobacteriaceae bacterium]